VLFICHSNPEKPLYAWYTTTHLPLQAKALEAS